MGQVKKKLALIYRLYVCDVIIAAVTIGQINVNGSYYITE